MQMLADGHFDSFWKLVIRGIHLLRHARSDLLLKPVESPPAGHYTEFRFQCSTDTTDIYLFLKFSERGRD